MCHVDNMLGAETLIHTGLDLCLEDLIAQLSIDCNTDILGTSSGETVRSALVTAPIILPFIQDKVQASEKTEVIRTIFSLLSPCIPLNKVSLAVKQLCFISCLAGGLLLLPSRVL